MEELSIIQLANAVYKQFYDLQTRVAQLHRKMLTQKMEAALLDFLKWVLQAKYAQKPHKAQFLLRAQAELGRMLGAWLKSLYIQ